MIKKNALIVGATGLTGKALLNILLTSDAYETITVLTRKPIQLKDDKIIEIIVDFNSLSSYKDLIKAEDVFCCLGTTINKAKSKEAFKKVDLHYPLEIAKMAKENGCKKFIVMSSMGANSKSSIFYSKVKGTMEEDLQKIDFETLHIMRPSMLLGNREEFRTGEYFGIIMYKLLSWAFMGSLKKYKAIHVTTVASAMLNLAQREDKGICIHPSNEIEKSGNM